MRAGLSQVLQTNSLPISKVAIPIQKGRSQHIADLLLALQRLYTHPKLSREVEKILREGINTKKAQDKEVKE